MNRRRIALVPLFALHLLAAAVVTAAEDEYELRHNPFIHPPLQTSVQRDAAIDRHGLWRPDLRATLVSASNPLVNIGGRLLAIGHEIDGYRLKRIDEGRATFEKDGQEVTVMVRVEQGENDD